MESAKPVSVTYTTANDTATAGSDYVAARGTVRIPAGQTAATITVTVNGDTVAEPDERFFLNLLTATNAGLQDPTGVGLIVDDDLASPLRLAASAVTPSVEASAITTEQAWSVLPAAIAAWQRTGLDAARLAELGTLDIVVADLSGPRLAQAEPGMIVVDANAAGQGWFVDPTPAEDSEFQCQISVGEALATPASPAFGRIDLLTVIMHELGHVLGLEDLDPSTSPHVLMDATLAPGVRHLTPETVALPKEGDHHPPTAAGAHGALCVDVSPDTLPPAALVFDAVTGAVRRDAEAIPSVPDDQPAPEAPRSKARINWDSAAAAVRPVEQEHTPRSTWWSRVQHVFWRNQSIETAALATGGGQAGGFATDEISQHASSIHWDQAPADTKSQQVRKKTAPSFLPRWLQHLRAERNTEEVVQGVPRAASDATKTAVGTVRW